MKKSRASLQGHEDVTVVGSVAGTSGRLLVMLDVDVQHGAHVAFGERQRFECRHVKASRGRGGFAQRAFFVSRQGIKQRMVRSLSRSESHTRAPRQQLAN